MQDETTATVTLVAQLRGRASFLLDRGEIKSPGLMNDAARTIEAQAQEIERLREELDMAAFRMQLLVDRMPPDEDGKGAKALAQGYVNSARIAAKKPDRGPMR